MNLPQFSGFNKSITFSTDWDKLCKYELWLSILKSGICKLNPSLYFCASNHLV